MRRYGEGRTLMVGGGGGGIKHFGPRGWGIEALWRGAHLTLVP